MYGEKKSYSDDSEGKKDYSTALMKKAAYICHYSAAIFKCLELKLNF